MQKITVADHQEFFQYEFHFEKQRSPHQSFSDPGRQPLNNSIQLLLISGRSEHWQSQSVP